MRAINRDVWSENVNFLVLLGGELPLPVQLGVDTWLNFPDASKYIEGDTGKIGQWLDSSTNGNTADQASGLLQPAYSSSVASFDGSDDQLDMTEIVFSGEVHMDLYLKPTTVDKTHIFADTNSAVANYTRITWSSTLISLDSSTTGGVHSINFIGSPVLNAVNHVRIMRDSSNDWSVELNGVGLSTGNPINWDVDLFSLSSLGGQRSVGSIVPTLEGEVSGVCLFNKSLTTQEKSDLKTYLDGLYL